MTDGLQAAITWFREEVAFLRDVRDRFDDELSGLRAADNAAGPQAQREGRADTGQSARARAIQIARRWAERAERSLENHEQALRALIVKSHAQPKRSRRKIPAAGATS